MLIGLTIVKGQTARLRFAARWPDGSVIDMTTAGYVLNLYLLRPGQSSPDEYLSTDSGRVTWTSQSEGEGYFLFSEAETANDSIWPAGQVKGTAWFTDANQTPTQKFPLTEEAAIYTVIDALLGEDP